MSAEFDDFINVVHKLSNEVEDGRLFSIAERRAIQLLLDAISGVNEKVLQRVDRQFNAD